MVFNFAKMVVGEVGSVQINGWPIHYEKFGHGPEVILMIPGAIGLCFIIYFHFFESNKISI